MQPTPQTCDAVRTKRREYARAYRARLQSGKPCKQNDPVRDLVNATDLEPEIVIAAYILRQALEDLRDVRAGKKFNPGYYPYYLDPAGEIAKFFAGEWFDFLANHLGLDPAVFSRMA